MGSSKKSHSGNCGGGQGEGEEELLSELFVIFKMLPLFSQGPSPSQLLSKVLLQGSMHKGVPEGHLSDV